MEEEKLKMIQVGADVHERAKAQARVRRTTLKWYIEHLIEEDKKKIEEELKDGK